MSVLRSVVRTVKLAGYFVRYGGELIVRRPQTRRARAEWLHRFCRAAIDGLGVRLTVENGFPARGSLVSNHLSYLDIVTCAAIAPCVFCSKAEIKEWPVFGWLGTMAGTMWIERGRGESALKAKGEMKAAADAGVPVVFFPEGTTTNGQEMLPFHSGLLAQVLGLDEPITAAYIRYQLDADNGPAVKVEDDVAYWGTRSMWPHVFRLLGLKGLHAMVRFSDGPIRFSSATIHRKLAAVEARTLVQQLGKETAAELVAVVS